MGLFGTKVTAERPRKPGVVRAEERAARLSTHELIDWIEGATGQLAHFVALRRSYNDVNAVPEAIMVAESIQGMLEELQSRALTSAP